MASLIRRRVPSRPMPVAGARVLLRIRGGAEHHARLDSMAGDSMLVTPVPALVRPGDDVHLSWGSARGWCGLAATFEGVTSDRVPLWSMKPLGDVAIVQRRTEARVGVVQPIELMSPGIRPVRAILIDLSAGGARCIAAAGSVLALGDTVSVQVDTGELHCHLGGTVARRVVSASGRVELAVRFRQPVREAERIRTEVLRLQRVERAQA